MRSLHLCQGINIICFDARCFAWLSGDEHLCRVVYVHLLACASSNLRSCHTILLYISRVCVNQQPETTLTGEANCLEHTRGKFVGTHRLSPTQPPVLDPKRARIHVPGLKNNPLFHEFGRQKVPLFLTNHEFSCVKYTPYFRVYITGIVATRSI